MRKVNLIVTCTSRKTQTPVRGLRLRDLREKSMSARAHHWIETLRAKILENESHTEASKLYCGEYWSVVRELPTEARKVGVSIQFWICSAGYGLITPDSEIRSYSATFSPEEGDCVTRGLDAAARRVAAQEWWKQIAMWSGPTGNRVRSLTSLTRAYPNTPLLVVASPEYLYALEKDLSGALDALADPDLLLIVSAGTRSFGKFSDNLVPCDARLQPLVGGTRASLNIRVAKLLIERSGKMLLGAKRVSAELGRLLKRQPPIENYQRRAVTDDQVRTFIRTQAHRNGMVISRSALLRKFRDSGKACEQSRFANLYRQMVIDEKVA
jgi:hypothetical protein